MSRLDPNSRLKVWDLLTTYRTGRTILLITHFMEAAEYLGSRVAVMANGKLQCCGTTTFLKHVVGLRYTLVITTLPSCDFTEITALLLRHLTTALLWTRTSFELKYSLEVDQTDKFSKLLMELDANRDHLRIVSYKLSSASLTEVFMRVTKKTAYERHVTSLEGNPFEPNEMSEAHNGVILVAQQVYGLFAKRLLFNTRRPLIMILQCTLPSFAMLLVFAAQRSQTVSDYPPLTLNTLSRYGRNIVAYSAGQNANNESMALAACYSKQFDSSLITTVDVNETSVNDFLLDAMKPSSYQYTYGYMLAAQFDYDNVTDEVRAVAFYNYEAYHTTAVSLSLIDNALLHHFVGAEYSIETLNDHIKPINSKRFAEALHNEEMIHGKQRVVVAFTSALLSLATNFCAIYLISERAGGTKRLQLNSKLHPIVFWAVTFVSDYIVLLIAVVGVYIAFVIGYLLSYIDGVNLLASALLFLMYGFAALPMTYIVSTFLTTAGIGMSLFLVITLLGPLLNYVITGALYNPDTETVNETLLMACFILMPSFGFARGLLVYTSNYWIKRSCNNPDQAVNCAVGAVHPCCPATCYMLNDCHIWSSNPLATGRGGIGLILIAFAIHGVTVMTLLVLVDSGVFQNMWHKLTCIAEPDPFRFFATQDADVARERTRVDQLTQNAKQSNEAIVMKDLSKDYGRICLSSEDRLAVDGLTVAIPVGEFFGLLGVNGAGKTTTCEMLAGNLRVSSGTAFVEGYEVTVNARQINQNVSYCSQFDSSFDYLTCRETMWLCARLRGMSSADTTDQINSLVTFFSMEEDIDKYVIHLSEGCSRKLNVAVAVIGNPSVILFDEPTVGMDPEARRKTWKVLDGCRVRGDTVLLATHSMVEAEKLCTRIGTIHKGRLTRLGNAMWLREKINFPYLLHVHTRQMPAEKVNAMIGLIKSTFLESSLTDRHASLLSFEIPHWEMNWSKLFACMRKVELINTIERFAVGDATLDDLFVTFQKEEKDGNLANISISRVNFTT